MCLHVMMAEIWVYSKWVKSYKHFKHSWLHQKTSAGGNYTKPLGKGPPQKCKNMVFDHTPLTPPPPVGQEGGTNF